MPLTLVHEPFTCPDDSRKHQHDGPGNGPSTAWGWTRLGYTPRLHVQRHAWAPPGRQLSLGEMGGLQILLDGVDTRRLNLRWLRSRMGLVSQEPVLFAGTVAQNIAFGCETTPDQSAIEEAARTANAHDFIAASPGGYSTQVSASHTSSQRLCRHNGHRRSWLTGPLTLT